MAFLTLDVALPLPTRLRDAAVRASDACAGRIDSAFRLGRPYPGLPDDEVCEPHVSLFMLRLHESRVNELLGAVSGVAARSTPVRAQGERWRPNPQGAPELHFRASPGWGVLQEQVVAAVAPLRDGLRERDPAGDSPAELIDRLRRQDPGGSRLAQLERYGYDEIAERFSPHVTVAWPRSRSGDGAPPGPEPSFWQGDLTRIGVYRMAPHGTCVRPFGVFPLSGEKLTPTRVIKTGGAFR
ncbi:hypothetical protein KIH74_14505 [Kineosporia sp. J2-2]|uniref:2'-5' RNA ligase n=1 Tax=Kineosporia corallincola TaxID=2835133 RepID=A0ABS5TGD0_9ACTN|nr:hypothetical protein [Kineosporia corallincola]MBT0770148.1 hypothetical protein [Kineosporia corallincola]